MTHVSPDVFGFFASLIEKETGIRYDKSNSHLLEGRLREFVKVTGYENMDSLWTQVRHKGLNTKERETLLDLATNNETSFFRDQEVFDFFKGEFVSKIFKPNEKLRIWCAATSTGQEPYSLAIIMAQLNESGILRDYSILATDLSERVLSQAKSGLYSQLEVHRGLSPQLLDRYFDEELGKGLPQPYFRVKPSLARNITFRRQNLLEPWIDHGPFHIVFCRNVLIYQDVEMKQKIIGRLAKVLTPGGYLVLGGAESLVGISDDFVSEQFGKACVYKLRS